MSLQTLILSGPLECDRNYHPGQATTVQMFADLVAAFELAGTIVCSGQGTFLLVVEGTDWRVRRLLQHSFVVERRANYRVLVSAETDHITLPASDFTLVELIDQDDQLVAVLKKNAGRLNRNPHSIRLLRPFLQAVLPDVEEPTLDDLGSKVVEFPPATASVEETASQPVTLLVEPAAPQSEAESDFAGSILYLERWPNFATLTFQPEPAVLDLCARLLRTRSRYEDLTQAQQFDSLAVFERFLLELWSTGILQQDILEPEQAVAPQAEAPQPSRFSETSLAQEKEPAKASKFYNKMKRFLKGAFSHGVS